MVQGALDAQRIEVNFPRDENQKEMPFDLAF